MKNQTVGLIFLPFLLLMLCPRGWAQHAAYDSLPSLSLQETLAAARKNNPSLQNLRLEQEKTQLDLKAARAGMLPRIEAYSKLLYSFAIPQVAIPGEIVGQTGPVLAEFGTRYDLSVGLQANQLLFSQSYHNSIKLMQKMVTLSGLQLEQQQQELMYELAKIYVNSQGLKAQIRLMKETEDNLSGLQAITQQLYEQDLARKIDADKLRVEQSLLASEIAQMQVMYRQMLGTLEQLCGVSLEVTELEQQLPAVGALSPLNDTHIDLQILDQQQSVVRQERQLQQQAVWPEVSLLGQYYYQGLRNEFDFFDGGDDRFFQVGILGLNLKVPLFNGLENRIKVQQAQLSLKQLHNERQQRYQMLQQEYQDARRFYLSHYQLSQVHRQDIELSERAYQADLRAYQAQLSSLSDLLEAESTLTRSRIAYMNALTLFRLAELALKKINGEPF